LVLPINALAFSLDGLFKGLGEAKFLRNVLIIATFIAFLPLLYIGQAYDMGLIGIWMALTVWMVIRAVLPYLKFKQILNHKIKETYR